MPKSVDIIPYSCYFVKCGEFLAKKLPGKRCKRVISRIGIGMNQQLISSLPGVPFHGYILCGLIWFDPLCLKICFQSRVRA